MITTPNLASIHNRIALLFGFQPWTISVSLRHAVGHLYEVREGDHIPWAEHIRGFTYRALIQLLRIHRFHVIKVKGSHTFAYYSTLSENRSFPLLLVRILDWLLASFPSLSYRLIVCLTKEENKESNREVAAKKFKFKKQSKKSDRNRGENYE